MILAGDTTLNLAPDSKRLMTPNGEPLARICGFETEYGLSYEPRTADENPLSGYAHKVVAEVGDLEKTEYWDRGQRIYVDIGDHPEYATAEGDIFLETAHRVLAGHVEMAARYRQIARQVKAQVDFEHEFEPSFVGLLANTCNAQGASWASHENYLTRRSLEPSDYIAALATHHASRIVWSGAGSVALADVTSNDYQFILSEKADHIWAISSTETTRARPLVNLRDTTLADKEKYRRIHNVAGESNMSAFAMALRLASGSIVLRACELGVQFEDLLPLNPVTAMRNFSNDPSLKAKVRLCNNKALTGIELNRAIAERCIQAAEKADYLSDDEKHWAPQWLQVLEDLQNNPKSCANRVDWVIKQKLIDRELTAKAKSELPEPTVATAWAKSIDYHRLLPQEGAGMTLVRRGFFVDSPSKDVLADGLPPPNTRAKLRSHLIAELRARRVAYRANWERVISYPLGRSIQLDEPYSTEDPRIDFFVEQASIDRDDNMKRRQEAQRQTS